MPRVTFREGRPAPDMTRDEVITWLLGSTGESTVTAGLVAAWMVSRVVDGLKPGTELPVDTAEGAYLLSVTVSGRWFRRVRTYHAREC